jgi:hypothetical protein
MQHTIERSGDAAHVTGCGEGSTRVREVVRSKVVIIDKWGTTSPRLITLINKMVYRMIHTMLMIMNNE